MDADNALALFALLDEERPTRWLQYHDGSWAPVWSDGYVGEAFTIADLVQLAHDATLDVLEGAGLIIQIIDIDPLEVVDTEVHSGDRGEPSSGSAGSS